MARITKRERGIDPTKKTQRDLSVSFSLLEPYTTAIFENPLPCPRIPTCCLLVDLSRAAFMNPRLFPRASTLLRPSIPSAGRLHTPRIGLLARSIAQNIITVKMADRVHRVTMFKMPSKDDQAKLLKQYESLGAEQQRVSDPSPVLPPVVLPTIY